MTRFQRKALKSSSMTLQCRSLPLQSHCLWTSKLWTSKRTHASTGQVCGTGPYISPEYEKRGQVSARTDAFALGIMIVELLLSVDPYVAREIADESLTEELATDIQQIHDGEVAVPTASAALVKDLPPVLPCRWPADVLLALGAVATLCQLCLASACPQPLLHLRYSGAGRL